MWVRFLLLGLLAIGLAGELLGPMLFKNLVPSYGGTLAAQSNNSTDNFKPVPYEPDEFSMFLQDLRRFEVVLIGLIPVTLLFGSLLYDIVYSISNPNINQLTMAISDEAIFQKIGISISISGLLAVLDLAIHWGHRSKVRKQRERVLRNSELIRGADTPEPRTGSAEVGGFQQSGSPGTSSQQSN